jgi:chromosome segregation ATPase
MCKEDAMQAQLQSRLAQLKNEYESGEKMLAELEAKQRTLRETLLRISGAIQVLEEELAKVEGTPVDTSSGRVPKPCR